MKLKWRWAPFNHPRSSKSFWNSHLKLKPIHLLHVLPSYIGHPGHLRLPNVNEYLGACRLQCQCQVHVTKWRLGLSPDIFRVSRWFLRNSCSFSEGWFDSSVWRLHFVNVSIVAWVPHWFWVRWSDIEPCSTCRLFYSSFCQCNCRVNKCS